MQRETWTSSSSGWPPTLLAGPSSWPWWQPYSPTSSWAVCAVLVPRGRQGQPVRRALPERLAPQVRLVRRARPVRLVPRVRPARKERSARLALLVLRALLVRPVRKARQGRLVLLARSARRAQPVSAGPLVPQVSVVRLVRRVLLASVARRAKRRRAEHASIAGLGFGPALLTPWSRSAIKATPSLRPPLSRSCEDAKVFTPPPARRGWRRRRRTPDPRRPAPQAYQ